MKIAYLGAGSWGFCLSSLLASKGYDVVCWTTKPKLAAELNATKKHPLLPAGPKFDNIKFTTDLAEALEGCDLLVESVTSAGIRPVFEKVKAIGVPHCPIIITSKGIEQNTGLILPSVVAEVLGEDVLARIGLLSGPSFAHDVVLGLPTSVVGSAFDYEIMMQICDVFMTKTFRVYPNSDIYGVAYGGALKNIVAIACGISDGLGLGPSARAALIARGLHEMRKLAEARGCQAHTLNGLSGLGDLVLTCSSPTSRNYSFGYRLGKGETPSEAEKEINMAVEGVYTCLSAWQLSQSVDVSMPITEAVYRIICGEMQPVDAVRILMQRTIKEEHL
ncbi:MAG: NAD(P)-dependent glycerol-3-phosphate dehydrogenase [Parachlamydiaceae bacterium]|nr:NAD(P)-dependent glycerol-3-phosphate dehydrogenase [Parachlamydiaceae bacterium]